MTLACLASQSCTEIGPAQPQLVTIYSPYMLVKEFILGVIIKEKQYIKNT